MKLIHETQGLRSGALVLLSSLASEKEYHRAVHAELDEWLHHERYSVYDGIQALGRVVEAPRSPRNRIRANLLSNANEVLALTSNYTAQVNDKKRLFEDRVRLHAHIAKVGTVDPLALRAWNKLRQGLESQSLRDGCSPGLTETLGALRVAYQLNRVLRNLLASAGPKDERARPVRESVAHLRELLSRPGQLDDATRAMFKARDGSRSIVSDIEDAESALTDIFGDDFGRLRPVLLETVRRIEEIARSFSVEVEFERPHVLPPPQFVLMWDVRGSTNAETREELTDMLGIANERIAAILRDRAKDFRTESRDDGNGLICGEFSDVLAVFQVLSEVMAERDYVFRAGCEANLQGSLLYYPRSRSLGGRAYEHAARVASFFKETAAHPDRWSGEEIHEPDASYLLVGEFARRYAKDQGQWPPPSVRSQQLVGQYRPRVSGSLPIEMSVVTC